MPICITTLYLEGKEKPLYQVLCKLHFAIYIVSLCHVCGLLIKFIIIVQPGIPMFQVSSSFEITARVNNLKHALKIENIHIQLSFVTPS